LETRCRMRYSAARASPSSTPLRKDSSSARAEDSSPGEGEEPEEEEKRWRRGRHLVVGVQMATNWNFYININMSSRKTFGGRAAPSGANGVCPCLQGDSEGTTDRPSYSLHVLPRHTHTHTHTHTHSQALPSSRPAAGSSGLPCGSGVACSMWRRGTSEAGGLCTRCSSAVSMAPAGSRRDEDASLRGHRAASERGGRRGRSQTKESRSPVGQGAESRAHGEDAEHLHGLVQREAVPLLVHLPTTRSGQRPRGEEEDTREAASGHTLRRQEGPFSPGRGKFRSRWAGAAAGPQGAAFSRRLQSPLPRASVGL